jgi:hypothetical protein
MQGDSACEPSEHSFSERIWLASKQHAFISILSLVCDLFPAYTAEASNIEKQIPRNMLIYAVQEGVRGLNAVELPCVRAGDLHRLPQFSESLRTLIQRAGLDSTYTDRVMDIQDVLLLRDHPADLVLVPMQPTKKQKRYDRVQLQKLTDPEYYTRKREYERQYRQKLREAARQMSAENLQKLQALSEADRDACLLFMH